MPCGRRRIPLDHNFPEPILAALDRFIIDVELVPLRRIDTRLTNLADRELIIALHQMHFDWLVTNNYKMLKNPQELAAIHKTGLTVFAIEGTGDDPLRATGALLLDLPAALTRTERGKVFWSRPRNPQPLDPYNLLRRAAANRNQSMQALHQVVQVTDEELARPWTDGLV